MGLETGNFIADLEPVYPLAADGKDQGDDHIRLIKTVLQNSIAGFPGAVLVGGTDTGVSNTYVLSPVDPLRAYSVNLTVLWLPATTNGGASTINISGLGPQPIRRNDGAVVENGDIMAGGPVAMLYTGTEFRLLAVTKRYVDQLVYSGVLPGQAGNAGKVLGTDGLNATFTNAFGVAMDEAEGAPIAATATLNLASAAGTGNFTHITGAATINAMTLPAGAERTLVFDGVNTLNNSGTLILPSGANIVTAPDDVAIVRGEGSGVTRVVSYERKSGRALAEQVVTAPGLVLLASATPANNVAAIDFLNVFSTTYDDYEVYFDGLSPIQAVAGTGVLSDISIQIAQSSIVDSSNAYTYAPANGGTLVKSAPSFNTKVRLESNGGVSTPGYGFCRLTIQSTNSSRQSFLSKGFSLILDDSGAESFAVDMAGVHTSPNSNPVTGIRVLLTNTSASGRFAAVGSIKIYGVRKA